jgi:hypothetical protein
VSLSAIALDKRFLNAKGLMTLRDVPDLCDADGTTGAMVFPNLKAATLFPLFRKPVKAKMNVISPMRELQNKTDEGEYFCYETSTYSNT